jgi:two-component system, sensor histidine kinase and response regulator
VSIPEVAKQKAVILVVDDQPENIQVLSDILRGDYTVHAAKNGEKALAAVSRSTPDLILLDIMMPGIDGYEVCRRIKTREQTQDIPVIFITALSDAADETKGLELGAIDYITKPFTPAIVKARVKNHLALREVTKLKEDVESIMRHDLKSPLTPVICLSQALLADDNLRTDQREMLREIEDAGYVLLSMINLSSTLIKIERGNYELKPASLDLAALIRKVFSSFKDTADMRRIRLELEYPQAAKRADADYPVRGEELLLYSMLANLVGNALDASPPDEAVTVYVQQTDDGGTLIGIRNKGHIPRAMKGRFFQKYVTAEKDRGTGLGTYSARLIARAHGGDITVQESNGAVTLEITIPALTDRGQS